MDIVFLPLLLIIIIITFLIIKSHSNAFSLLIPATTINSREPLTIKFIEVKETEPLSIIFIRVE